MKAILTFLLLFAVTADAQFLQHRRKEFYRGIYEVTDTFDNYPAGITLSGNNGWTHVYMPDFTTVAGGAVVSSADYATLNWAPPRFIYSQDMEAECTLLAAPASAGYWGGVMVAMKRGTLEGLQLVLSETGILYMGCNNNTIGLQWYTSLSVGTGIPAGSKIKLLTRGTGVNRRLFGSYNLGAGWVSPPAFQNVDMSNWWVLNDVGTCGLFVSSNNNVKIDSITIRNQSNREQSFDGYAANTTLIPNAGWTSINHNFYVLSPGVTYAFVGGAYAAVKYAPAGFVYAPNHEVEVVLTAPSNTGATAIQGALAAVQPSGHAYLVMLSQAGDLYLGRYDAVSNSATDFVSVNIGIPPAGTRVKVSVTGVGAARRVTGSYNIGAGWVTPGTFLNKDFGAGFYYDGGVAGILGYGGISNINIDALTVRNLP